MDHQLTKTTSGWTCGLCQWTWKARPRAKCPGVRRYAAQLDTEADRDRLRPDHLQPLERFKPLNLKPRNNRVGCLDLKTRWVDLYDVRDAEVDDPNLPPIYNWLSRPDHLKTERQLYRYNLTAEGATASGCCWNESQADWIYLYDPAACPVLDPTLPPYCDYAAIPANLKTERKLKALHLRVGDARPRLFTRWWNQNDGWITLLYYCPDECEWDVDRDQYLTKTTLKRTYLLSDGWIDRIGAPDLRIENPHHRRFADMCLYSRRRIEAYLSEHAEAYAAWLTERNRRSAIFEQNRAAIEAGRQQFVTTRRQQRQSRRGDRHYRDDESLAKRELRRNPKRFEAAPDVALSQMIRCFQCASGAATPDGYLCVIHPKGLEAHEMPCPDWCGRR